LTPDDAAALNDLGSALAMQGQLGRAETLFGRAIRIEPEHALAHYNLAGVLARRGRLGEAVEHYQIAKRLRPDDREIARELETMRSALAASGSSKR
jgi:Flp pilus assembly protein TadD